MENNPFFMKLYSEINDDFATYSPMTTDEEKMQIINKAMRLFSSNTFSKIKEMRVIEEIDDPIGKFKSGYVNNLFMCRSLLKEIPIPHNPPSHYKIFNETSTNLYENYSRTLDYLTGKFYLNDVISCRDDLNNFNTGRVLCWSNTNILLDHILQTNYQYLDIDLVTFGSPLLIPNYTTLKNSVNLYHEDDWMLGFVSALYNINISDLQKDKLIEIQLDNDQICRLVIISKNKFQIDFTLAPTLAPTLPHRYYYAFF